MRFDLVEALFLDRLADVMDIPIKYDNTESLTIPKPYLLPDHVPALPIDSTLSGAMPIHEGYWIVNIFTEPNKFVTPGLEIAQRIADAFPRASKIEAPNGGYLTISLHPRVIAGYADGDAWRTPLRLDYEAS